MGAQGTTTIDFGSTPAESASVNITGQTSIIAGSHAEAFWMADSTAGNTATDHEEASAFCRLVCTDVVAGTGFTIKAFNTYALATGTFTIRWVWN